MIAVKMDFFNGGNNPCIVSKDLARRIVNCNQQFLDFYGKTKNEVIGKTIEELRPNERFGYLYKKHDKMILAGKTFTAYHPGVSVDGRITFYHAISEIKAELDGTMSGFKLSFYDTGKDSLFSLIPSIEFTTGKYECDYANVGKSLFDGIFRTIESYLFYYLVRGWDIPAIAKKLDIDLARAEEVKEMVFGKMGVDNVDDLFDVAARQDMLCNVPKDLLYKKPKPTIREDKQDKKAHYLQYASEIKKIVDMSIQSTQPLLSFTYGNVFVDNSAILLTTHPELMQKSIEDKTAADFQMLDEIFKAQQVTSGGEKTFSYIKKQRGAKPQSGIMLGHHHGDSIEIFSFGFEDVCEKTLKKEHLSLVKFCHTFMGHAKTIIDVARKDKICLVGARSTKAISRNFLDMRLLTARETEVMELLVRSMPIKLIAKKLDIAPNTVKDHSKRLKEKLNVTSIPELSEKYWF